MKQIRTSEVQSIITVVSVAPTLYKGNVSVTRGNDLRLKKSQVKYDLRKFSLTNGVVNTWNSLPNWVVSTCLLTLLTCSKRNDIFEVTSKLV